MINQKPISLKLDCSVIDALDQECYVSSIKRNRAINEACRAWYENRDQKRREMCGLGKAAEITIQEALDLQQEIALALTSKQLARLEHIAKGWGRNRNYVITYLLIKALEDYDRKPFAYLP